VSATPPYTVSYPTQLCRATWRYSVLFADCIHGYCTVTSHTYRSYQVWQQKWNYLIYIQLLKRLV